MCPALYRLAFTTATKQRLQAPTKVSLDYTYDSQCHHCSLLARVQAACACKQSDVQSAMVASI
jgi:hypothetical protein